MEENLAVKGRNGHVYGIERTSSGNTTGKSRGDEKIGEFLIHNKLNSPQDSGVASVLTSLMLRISRKRSSVDSAVPAAGSMRTFQVR